MAKVLIEDIVLFVVFLQLVSAVIFNMNMFGAYYPNQQWNSTSNSLEYYEADSSPSIFGNLQGYNDTMAQYGNVSNNTILDPGALVNPLGIVSMVGFYFNLIIGVLTGGFIYIMLSYFVGATWAGVITGMLSICMIVMGVHVITGRIRWS